MSDPTLMMLQATRQNDLELLKKSLNAIDPPPVDVRTRQWVKCLDQQKWDLALVFMEEYWREVNLQVAQGILSAPPHVVKKFIDVLAQKQSPNHQKDKQSIYEKLMYAVSENTNPDGLLELLQHEDVQHQNFKPMPLWLIKSMVRSRALPSEWSLNVEKEAQIRQVLFQSMTAQDVFDITTTLLKIELESEVYTLPNLFKFDPKEKIMTGLLKFWPSWLPEICSLPTQELEEFLEKKKDWEASYPKCHRMTHPHPLLKIFPQWGEMVVAVEKEYLTRVSAITPSLPARARKI